MTRAELIKALEALEGPSREMDLEIARIQGTVVLRHNRETGSNYEYTHHLYTSSIDSALTLVPEGWMWSRMRNLRSRQDRVRRFHITLSKPVAGSTSPKEGSRQGAKHKLTAIALCIACLRAGGAE